MTNLLSAASVLLSRDVSRRDCIRLLAGATASLPIVARANQSTIPIIGYLAGGSAKESASAIAGFRQGLAELGYVDGRNLVIDFRWAEGKYDLLPSLALDLVRRRVAVIVAADESPALAAQSATSIIPIVFSVGFDPVEEKLVKTFARPGINATGVRVFTNALNPKRLEILWELVPNVSSFAVLINPEDPYELPQASEAYGAARKLGVGMTVVFASSEGELTPIFAALAKKVDGLIVFSDRFFALKRNRIVALAAQYRVPTIYCDRRFVDAGGLISYSEDYVDSWRQVGLYTARILDGVSAADLPVVQSTRFDLIINLRAASALSLTIPTSMLARAKEVIE